MEEIEDKYTKDGTTDIHVNPTIKKETGKWSTCPCILVSECCERLAYYGMNTNLVNYVKDCLHQGNTTASNNVSNWSGMCYMTPLLGAFIGDAYLGRYWTIASFIIFFIIGLTLLTMTSTVKGLKPSFDNGVCDPTQALSVLVFVSVYIIAIGTGGIKPCVSSFGADQFDEFDESEEKSEISFFN